MKLEQLQSLSDAELNELAAVKVMGWIKEANDYHDKDGKYMRGDAAFWNHHDVWNPTGDMNDAMTLLLVVTKSLIRPMSQYLYPSITFKNGKCEVYFSKLADAGIPPIIVTANDNDVAKCITIASILAKEE